MIYAFTDFELDLAQVELRRAGEPVAIEPQVFALICLLVENHERMVAKDEIVEKVWDRRPITDATLASRIKVARQILGDDGEAQRVIRTVRGRGFRFVAEVRARGARIAESATVTLSAAAPTRPTPIARREPDPAVAVLPFQWVGRASADAIVAEALPHELITALSRLRWLAVTARGSSFRFRTPDIDVRDVGKALSVGYCVSGIVERRGKRLSIAVDLTDTQAGRVIWSQRFECAVEEIHDVRAEVVVSIVAALELQIPLHEAHLARLRPPDSLDAWASYHLGLQAMYRFNKSDNAGAERHFQRAIELDPQFARAHAGLSFTSFQEAFLSYSGDPLAAAQQARRHAERSVELDPYDAFANFVMGRAFWLSGNIDISLDWLDRAIVFSPSFAQGLYARGWADAVAGRGIDSRTRVDAAMRLSPVDPLLYAMMATRALAHIAEGEMDAAVPWAEKAANAPGAHLLIAVIAVVAHGLAGDHRRAAFWAANVRSRGPEVTRERFFRSFPFTRPGMRREVGAVLEQYGF